jgi:hypothetical protein
VTATPQPMDDSDALRRELEAFLAGLAPLNRPLPASASGTVRDAVGFRQRIDAFQREVLKRGQQLQQRVVAETLHGLTQTNPVGNRELWKQNRSRIARGLPLLPKGYVGGRSRAGWKLSIGGDDVVNAIRGMQPGQSLRIVNPAPYMEALNRGHSSQAPAGWIDAVIARVLAKYARPV